MVISLPTAPPAVGAPTLRPYQVEAIAAVTDGLQDGGTGQLHAACGSGKTLMGQQAALRLLPAGGLAVVLVPSLTLVSQTIGTWRALPLRDLPLRVLAVCSDDSVIDAPAHLADIDADTTTDPQEIAAWLTRPFAGLSLIVGTYQSADRLKDAQHRTDSAIDMLILDEAHHLTGAATSQIRQVVAPSYLPAHRRLFMTATPRYATASSQRAESFLSMDDTDTFGPVLYDYPFSRGIAEGYLEDYRLFVVGIREAAARHMLTDQYHEFVDGPGAPSLQTMVAQAALVQAAERFGTRRAISFHHRVEDAQEFARSLPALAGRLQPGATPPQCAAVHGEMDHGLRDRILDGLRHPPEGGWSVVSNSRCLGEGVDVPAVDAVLFAHPKSSAVDIVQAVGRALRAHGESRGVATIIVPLIVPDDGDGEIGDLDAGEFETIWRVVRALRAHDEPLGISLDCSRSTLPSASDPGLPDKITVQLPQGTSRGILQQLQLMLVRQTTSPWWEGIGHATAYREEHGHLRATESAVTPDGYALGRWLGAQRGMYRRGLLSPDRVAALEALGIDWDLLEARWQIFLDAARSYRAIHGHLRVPTSYETPDGYPLGKQLNARRSQYRAGELRESWAADLSALGMVWGPARTWFWSTHEQLSHYRDTRGHLDLRVNHVTDDGRPLGKAVAKLRARRGNLLPEEEQALNELGFHWDSKQQTAGLVDAADRFRAAHPDAAAVPLDYEDESTRVRLAGWLADVAAGQLPISRADTVRLHALGLLGAMGRPSQQWEENLAAFTVYRSEQGHLDIPAKYETPGGQKLGKALAGLRHKYRTGKLTPDRIKALEELGVVWSPRDAGWTEFLAACDRYIERNGDLRVPVSHVTPDGYTLGAKIVFYRKLAKGAVSGSLQPERRAALEERGMVWDARRQT
ncbi:Helicase associated domain protein [Streptomyces sp. NPDC087850]|uniref:DEAD/DEAH box helicase n=1 Tax=Streptomyces sp. NPDC087850 TaxID=3365809 RepID=UPI0037F478A6